MKKILSIGCFLVVLLLSYLEYNRRTNGVINYKDPSTRKGLEYWGLCDQRCAMGELEESIEKHK